MSVNNRQAKDITDIVTGSRVLLLGNMGYLNSGQKVVHYIEICFGKVVRDPKKVNGETLDGLADTYPTLQRGNALSTVQSKIFDSSSDLGLYLPNMYTFRERAYPKEQPKEKNGKPNVITYGLDLFKDISPKSVVAVTTVRRDGWNRRKNDRYETILGFFKTISAAGLLEFYPMLINGTPSESDPEIHYVSPNDIVGVDVISGFKLEEIESKIKGQVADAQRALDEKTRQAFQKASD